MSTASNPAAWSKQNGGGGCPQSQGIISLLKCPQSQGIISLLKCPQSQGI